MANRNSNFYLVFLMVCISWITGCQMNHDSVLGAVDIRDEEMEGPWPAGVPKTIYVSDFALGSEHLETDQGVRGVLPDSRSRKIGRRLPHPLAPANPEEQARKIIGTMSQSLVKNLTDKGLVAERLSESQSVLPREGWLLQGVFTEVGEGNRIKRATIGFGRGATSMEAQVAVSNLASENPKAPFIVFGTFKNPKKMPGAAVSLNPYVAAAKFVMEKNATEQDIQNTAEQIADEILKHAQKFKEQAEAGKSAK